MRPLAILLGIALLLALDGGALHDIVVGKPDVKAELATLALGLLTFSILWYAHTRRGQGWW